VGARARKGAQCCDAPVRPLPARPGPDGAPHRLTRGPCEPPATKRVRMRAKRAASERAIASSAAGRRGGLGGAHARAPRRRSSALITSCRARAAAARHAPCAARTARTRMRLAAPERARSWRGAGAHARSARPLPRRHGTWERAARSGHQRGGARAPAAGRECGAFHERVRCRSGLGTPPGFFKVGTRLATTRSRQARAAAARHVARGASFAAARRRQALRQARACAAPPAHMRTRASARGVARHTGRRPRKRGSKRRGRAARAAFAGGGGAARAPPGRPESAASRAGTRQPGGGCM
jgi:hypothetical protein